MLILNPSHVHPEENTYHFGINHAGFVGVLLFKGGKWHLTVAHDSLPQDYGDAGYPDTFLWVSFTPDNSSIPKPRKGLDEEI